MFKIASEGLSREYVPGTGTTYGYVGYRLAAHVRERIGNGTFVGDGYGATAYALSGAYLALVAEAAE